MAPRLRICLIPPSGRLRLLLMAGPLLRATATDELRSGGLTPKRTTNRQRRDHKTHNRKSLQLHARRIAPGSRIIQAGGGSSTGIIIEPPSVSNIWISPTSYSPV